MLKGEMVYLKAIERKDMNIIYNICSEKEVRLYDGGGMELPPYKDIMKNYDKFMIIDRKSLTIINEKNVIIGYISYKELQNTVGVYDIGITIGSRYWGRGYGKDSVRTLIKYLFETQSAHRIELEVVVNNERAVNCYKACGFIEEGRKREKYYNNKKYYDTLVMSILKKDYRSH
ncbi:GNAT family N-acetyltransferase [Clostridium paridis]|uniref:GNAT family N-acetyltransferase n=1 Tax=Clostridium paridis TaxID=2803863 RepID=A0A937K6E2_9CLOT|nr:GNAT family N-acetyltransferase [Clostridium paridis]